MTENIRFLIIDGYVKKSRDELAAGGASTAGDLYSKMLKRFVPDASCDVVYPSDPGCKLPTGAGLSDYDGIAWTGCSLTAYDGSPEVRNQIEFCRAGFEARVPAFGSCWAAQIAVVAAGGIVQANPRGREMGIARKIELTPEGRSHPMYIDKANVFDAFISHVDEITHMPTGSSVLASNAFTRVQAVSVVYKGGVFWSPQYHPEYDLHELARLTWCRIDVLIKLGFFKNREDAEKYVDLLETLHQDHDRSDLAWLLGIDDDVMKEDIRQLEVRNWIEQLVIPSLKR
ncbi:MAG: type 1 glutamine amidotransferase [Rhodospirillaceae bacterium]|nr:type 1 glutamine amidotransferase [Rhodospirillaceae bacterium]